MTVSGLCDLYLAGVQWETTDIPTTVLARTPTTNTTTNNTRTTPEIRGITIVPPIAPVQTVSVETAVAMATRPTDIDALLRMIAEFNHPLRAGVTNVVLPSIAINPNGLVIVTDVPGADDDATGKILSGAAGELLDKMIMAIGMSRESVSIVPMIFWRTPGGRTPTRAELDLSRPFVNRLLDLLAPRFILTLGTLPAAEIGNVQLARDHGTVLDMANGIKLMSIFHPNYLLLKPNAKRDAWTALQILRNLLKND